MVAIKRKMKIWTMWLAACGAITAMGVVSAAEFDAGQALYENHCQYCHESWAHERDGRKVTSKAGLRQMVEAWSIHASLDWDDEAIDAVADYLNHTFYKFAD